MLFIHRSFSVDEKILNLCQGYGSQGYDYEDTHVKDLLVVKEYMVIPPKGRAGAAKALAKKSTW